ncbi:MAG: hypothetical protein LBK99_01875, partial [Opitutaceae bacterium]|nr:hypothetical protein [Opitutaceae bacterium]
MKNRKKGKNSGVYLTTAHRENRATYVFLLKHHETSRHMTTHRHTQSAPCNAGEELCAKKVTQVIVTTSFTP